MLRKVAIIGYAMSDQASEIHDTRDDIIFDTVRQALENTGITRDDVDTVIMCSNDFYDGRTISNVFTVESAGAYEKDETKVEQDGIHAMGYGVMRVASGAYDVAMIVAYSKASEFERHVALSAQLDPTYDRKFGFLHDGTAAGLQARAYMAAAKLSEDDLAQVAVKNLNNAAKNPNAKAREKYDVTVEDVLNSKKLYEPLNELTCYPGTDGCCVLILAGEDVAKKTGNKPVWVKGVSSNQELYYLGERNLSQMASARAAAKKAYKMAGIKKPAEEIQLAEVSEMFAHQELMITEALGLCRKKQGSKFLEQGNSGMDGSLPVNPSGGALAACALGAVGLVRVVEAAKQITEQAGEHQVTRKVKTALAHGQCGMAAQNNVVAVLGK
jgi:acetyl-CoA C-acetyltransferase